RGNVNSELGSEIGAPVPFDFGRPAPSCTVNLALKSCAPYSINCRIEVVNSSPSCKCVGIATSRPTSVPGLCAIAAIPPTNGNNDDSPRQMPRRVLVIAPSFRNIDSYGLSMRAMLKTRTQKPYDSRRPMVVKDTFPIVGGRDATPLPSFDLASHF